jgi:hypothetical protein
MPRARSRPSPVIILTIGGILVGAGIGHIRFRNTLKIGATTMYRDIAKLFSSCSMMMVAFLLSLAWLWKLRIVAPDVKIVVVYLGMFGIFGYLGTLLLLFRLRRKMRGPSAIS